MTKMWLIALALAFGLGATVAAQEQETPEKQEAEKSETQEAKSDSKAIEFLEKADEKLYTLEGAGAKDVKVVLTSSLINETLAADLGEVDLKFVLLWKEGKEPKMRVEGLPPQFAVAGDQLAEAMMQPGKLALDRPLVEKAKDFVVTMEKDGDLTKIIMVARDEDASSTREVVWFNADHLPVKSEATQQSAFGPPNVETVEIELREIDVEGDKKQYVKKSIKPIKEEGEGDQVIEFTYRKTDKGFFVLEKLETEEQGQAVELEYDVTVNGGIPDSEFSG